MLEHGGSALHNQEKALQWLQNDPVCDNAPVHPGTLIAYHLEIAIGKGAPYK